MEMVVVDSSSIDAIGYDANLRELHVRFKRSSITYVYQGVSADMHERMMQSPSKGQFFVREVRDVYPFRRI